MKLLPLLLALAPAALHAAPACCAPAAAAAPVAPVPHACCAADAPAGTAAPATAAFTTKSIYQLDGQFTDDTGQPFTLGQLRGRPVVLNLFFASCGYACPLTVTNLLRLQNELPPALRDRVTFVLVSFDVARDTPAALALYRQQRQLGPNWILLHGDDASVRELAALLGEKYKQNADGSFSHSNLQTVLNPEGEIVHQHIGLEGGRDEMARALTAAE